MKSTVLIIDDSAFMRHMIREVLESNGYNVIGEAANGVDGIHLYKQLQPQIVTLDIIMPGMDGIRTLQLIRTCDEHANVVICSAMGQQALVLDALKNGAIDFVVKPFDKDRLLCAVNKIRNMGSFKEI